MLATAFETALGVQSRSDKGMAIAEGLQDLLVRGKESDFLHDEQKVGEGKKKKPVTKRLSRLAWWGRDFYRLRNRVAHGECVPLNALEIAADDGQTFSCRTVAAIVLRDLITRQVYSPDLLGEQPLRPAHELRLSLQMSPAYKDLGLSLIHI